MKTTRALSLFVACALLGLVFLALPITTAHAFMPIIVRVTPSGTTTWPCGHTDWSNPCALDTALTNASSGYELWVGAGTYTPTVGVTRTATFQLKSGVALYGGFAGGETARTQRNYTAHVTILSGDIGTPNIASDNAYHVVTGGGATNTAVLDGFTITGGKADSISDPGRYGGGMYNSAGSPTVANVIFSGNSAGDLYDGYGGGMYNESGSNPRLTNVTFISNTADLGGGMYNVESSPMIANSTFIRNSARYGGGIEQEMSNATLTNVSFISNTASSDGGGMNSEGSSSPTLVNVTFISNTANTGGGMVNFFKTSPTLTNVTFSGNSAGSNGGAMYNYFTSNPTITNAIFWGNTAPNGPQIYNNSSTPSLSDSVVEGGYTGGTNIIAADPHLGLLGYWGGATQTIPLLPGSSAIDAGNDSTCGPTDQRGKPRVGTCDIGAFEFQGFTGFTLAKVSGDNQSTRTHTPFAAALEAALTDTGDPVPLPGVTITFTAPSSGASAAWSGSLVVTATTNASGVATVAPPTANSITGSYAVTANTAGAPAPVTFNLTNLLHDAFLPLLQR